MSTIDYSAWRFHHDDWGRLVVTQPDGTVHTDVEPVRCFPWTAPHEAIALVGADGHEIANIPALAVLSAEAGAILERDLSHREFVPKISRITRSSGPWPPCTWDVITDRGETVVKIDSEDDVRKIGKHGALIADSDGVRYLIADTTQLDATSLRHLRRLV
ncbi:MAG TPA: DUF1854 domain-containing protein [Planctomycetaceae bacterium]|jgi:hypothetical protein|nr:DUF1854 domain-containing protein [Planctomycetaceae bacterium]